MGECNEKYSVCCVFFVFDNAGESTATLESEQDAILIKVLKENLFAVTRDQLCKVEK